MVCDIFVSPRRERFLGDVRKTFLFNGRFAAWLIATALLSLATASDAIILFRTGDPSANTTEPTGSWIYSVIDPGFANISSRVLVGNGERR